MKLEVERGDFNHGRHGSTRKEGGRNHRSSLEMCLELLNVFLLVILCSVDVPCLPWLRILHAFSFCSIDPTSSQKTPPVFIWFIARYWIIVIDL